MQIPVASQGHRAIRIRQISFHWAADASAKKTLELSRALPVRENPSAAGRYAVPEYMPSTGRMDVPAVYAAGQRDIIIKVVFETSDPGDFFCHIQGKALASNRILGNTTLEPVFFSAGRSEEIRFVIPGLIPRQLCKSVESWQWSARFQGELQALCRTRHVVYCVPGYPRSPWKCTGDSTCAPWTELLDMVVRWVPQAVADNPVDTDLLRAMTIGVYSLGDPDVPNHKIYEDWNTRGGFHYNKALFMGGYLKFDLWAVMDMSGACYKNRRYNRLIDRQSPKTSSNRYVDCSDVNGLLYCAARMLGIEQINIQTISSDNNLLGLKRFYYTPIQPIGRAGEVAGYAGNDPAGPANGAWWSFHQVVSYCDPCDHQTRYVYDASLKFVTDGAVDDEPPVHMSYPTYYQKIFCGKYDLDQPGFVWDKPVKVINEIARLFIFARGHTARKTE